MHISNKSSTFAADMTEEQKNNIITCAAGLFNKFGIRSVSIDDISREMGMSKKTFYQYFSTKDELVEAMLIRHENYMREQVEVGGFREMPALDVMLHFVENTQKAHDVRRIPPLVYDLKKYYPQQTSEHIARVTRINKEYMVALVRRGQMEGDFRAELNPETCGTLFAELNQQMLNIVTEVKDPVELQSMCALAADLLTRGIVSDQGRDKLK